MSENACLGEILAISYGDIHVETGCVLAELMLRVPAPDLAGQLRIGVLDPILIPHDMLAGLWCYRKKLLAAMMAAGADRDVLPAPSVQIPAWDSGPLFSSPDISPHCCKSLKLWGITAELGAVIVRIETSPLTGLKESFTQDLLLSYRSLPAHHERLELILEKMGGLGIGPQLQIH